MLLNLAHLLWKHAITGTSPVKLTLSRAQGVFVTHFLSISIYESVWTVLGTILRTLFSIFFISISYCPGKG